MSDYDKKVTPKEPDPYENISINPIEKNKQRKEEFSKNLQEPTKSQILATLISYFKKILTFFTFKNKNEFFLFDQHQLFEHLSTFRTQLQILTTQDESHNPEFTQQLTELWHNLVDDCNSISPQEVSPNTIEDIKFFISQISHYPYQADHSLGYYFDASAGKEWIPFPFMDMLKELHDEYQETPINSHLFKWISLIDDILEN